MKVKSTLRVIDQANLKGHVGVIPGQSMKRLVGCPEVPTDRVRVGLATYAPGSIEELHWHPIESYYFVISGHATVRNFEGGQKAVHGNSIASMRQAIEGAGIKLLFDERGAAAGIVRHNAVVHVLGEDGSRRRQKGG